MINQLEQLRQFTTIVADTGDFNSISTYQPQDATTNPSLILKAAQQDEYRPLLEEIVQAHAGEPVVDVMDQVLVAFGRKILDIVPGRVSTEVDARLSFDTAATVAKAQNIIALYEAAGVSRDRVLIKIASTWEGIKAAEQLEQEGIHCNLTLLFSLTQAAACADAKVQLISPFVGRIYDWYKKDTGIDYAPADDPGVASVGQIFTYYKKFGYETEIMGASFRNAGQVLELAGCDLLTVSPALLAELQDSEESIERKLLPEAAASDPIERMQLNETQFRFLLNEDAMATEKTAEGIRRFSADIVTLENLIAELQAT